MRLVVSTAPVMRSPSLSNRCRGFLYRCRASSSCTRSPHLMMTVACNEVRMKADAACAGSVAPRRQPGRAHPWSESPRYLSSSRSTPSSAAGSATARPAPFDGPDVMPQPGEPLGLRHPHRRAVHEARHRRWVMAWRTQSVLIVLAFGVGTALGSALLTDWSAWQSVVATFAVMVTATLGVTARQRRA